MDDDPTGGHVFAGTTTGIYESVDAAESWQLLEATASFGRIRTLLTGVIGGTSVILAGGAT